MTFLALPLRLLRRHRRVVAALLAGLATLALAAGTQPAPVATVPVVVAARDVPGGATLAAGDLTVAQVPRSLAPAAALRDPAALVGRLLSAPVDQGVALTAHSVVSDALAASTPGRVLAPLRLPDPDLAVLLQPGTRVDVVAADESQASVVARGAHVVAVPRPGAGGGGPLAGSSDTRGLLVIVEVSPEESTALARAAARGRLGIALG